MKSPFPGMDPYIESYGDWGGFHARLIAHLVTWLDAVLPPQYLARPQQREVIELVEEAGKRERAMFPDVKVTGPASPGREGAVAVAEPTSSSPHSLRAYVAEEFRESFVEIYSVAPERRLVTCIEVLSLANKRPGSRSREQYLRKRQALLLGETNLVELDLLRAGQRMPMVDPWPNSPYVLLVGRWYKDALCQVWPASFRWPLPHLPIPLDRQDPDLLFDLQSAFSTIYESARYSVDINYTKPLAPPLNAPDQTWVAELLAAQRQ